MSNNGWIGVDFDGTLARYDTWVSAVHCGEPIAPMVERVKAWLVEGRPVRIFTARVFPMVGTPDTPGYIPPDINWALFENTQLNVLNDRQMSAYMAARAIQEWSLKHLGVVLPITCVKDYSMITLYDDRCVQVRPNTGELVEPKLGFNLDGEWLYGLYQKELHALNVGTDDFEALDLTDQTAWHCVAYKLGAQQ